jgi:16S rRNA (guanine1516-N2)-methyltransferase
MITTIAAVAVSSTTNSGRLLPKAESLAAKLQLPLLSGSPFACFEHLGDQLILTYTDDGLQLILLNIARKKHKIVLYVDFCGGKNGYRLRHNLTVQQPLARAVGIKGGCRPAICDATGGFGADAFVMASLGCRTVVTERNAVMHALLADGLARAAENPDTCDIADRIELLHQDGRLFMQSAGGIFDTVYLDPMYPVCPKSSLNSLQMRVLRDLVGDDDDSGALWLAAMASARRRVVVKRPQKGASVASQSPSFRYLLKSSRFDVYLTPPHQYA